ncbi:MAG TPA: serine/threonine-protein kinase [Kofleriaceae bacterium]|nr:serine/threonine-protein kinase [Kofleriaceae bacterium]
MQPGGQLIDGKYQLVSVAGEGGMATVYKAVTKGAAGFQRTVAIKHIKPEYRALKNYVDMFIEEARVGSELAHPNIVQVFDFIAEDGSYYLVMEWVEGIDLGHFIRMHRDNNIHVEWPLAVAIGIGTLRGLGAAHDRRGADGTPSPVIHRDVTPHNILLGVNGVVKLTDFGLARARDRVASMTAPGTVKGKLSYLAPEVSFGKTNTPQSDLFGVGSVMWETLAGERLFDGKSDVEIFKKIRACKVPPIGERRPDIPGSLVAVLDVALAANPADRFESATAFAHALSQVMKQAVGIDPQTALGQAVRELKTRGTSGSVEVKWSVEADYDVSRADSDADPIELTKPKK